MLQSIGLFFLGIIFGAVAGTWHSYYMRRPKIEKSGGGSSRCGDYYIDSITFSNRSRLLGVRFLPTIIFGRRIHEYWQAGLSIDTDTAFDVYANLYDKSTGSHVANLFWFDQGILKDRIDIPCNKNVNLIFAGHLADKPKSYFFPKYNIGEIDLSNYQNIEQFDVGADFEIWITRRGVFRPSKYEVKAQKRFDGTIEFIR